MILFYFFWKILLLLFSTFRQFDNDGAAPVQIEMTLSFTETEIMTKETIAQGY